MNGKKKGGFREMDPALFRQFAENTEQGMCLSEEDGNILYMNKALVEMLGYGTIKELEGKRTVDFYREEDLGPKKEEIREGLKKRGKWSGKIRMKKKDGTTFPTKHDLFILDLNGRKTYGNILTDLSNLERATKGACMERKSLLDLIDSLGDWVWEMDLNGVHTYSNSAIKDILGYGVDEVVGKDTMKLWPDETLTDKEKKRHRDSLKKGKGWFNFRALFRHKDGHRIYTLSSGVPLFDENGELIGYRGIDRDITKNVEREKQLKSSRERMESIIRTAVEVIFTLKPDGTVDFISPSVERSLGFSNEEMEGKNAADFVHPDDLPSLKEKFSILNETRAPIEGMVYRARKKNGGWRWKRANLSPLLDGNGEISMIVCVSQDIDKRKQDQERILQLNELLKLINKILRHDLTNNLFMIRTAMDHYKMVKDDKWLESADMKVESSFSLIEQMRSLETIVSAGGSLRVVDVREALERISSGFDIPIEIVCSQRVMADDAFYSIIENLIRNAITHGRTDRMLFRCNESEEEGFLFIDVIDFGSGVDDSIKDNIFDETFRHGKTGGSGLGLYIVKKTIERYGGNITVFDNKPKGSIFRIKLKEA